MLALSVRTSILLVKIEPAISTNTVIIPMLISNRIWQLFNSSDGLHPPPMHKWLYPEWRVAWGKVYNETGMNIAMCSIAESEGTIAGGVILLNRMSI